MLVGLGNPGPGYENTRHNVGFWFLDYLAHRLGFGDFMRETTCLVTEGSAWGFPLLLVKPFLYMNRSGQALTAFWRKRPFDVASALVVFDDVALPVGRIRLRARGSSGGHNGMDSIIEAAGTRDIARLRFGIGAPEGSEDLADYVLDQFAPGEEDAVLDRFPDAEAAVQLAFTEGIEAAMSRFNR